MKQASVSKTKNCLNIFFFRKKIHTETDLMYVQHVNIHQRMDENFSPFIQNITGPNNHLHAYQHTTPCTPINSKTCSHFDTRGITLHGRRTHRQTDRQRQSTYT